MKQKLFYFFKNYLGFTKREAKGFVMVLPVLFVLYAVPWGIRKASSFQTEQIKEQYLGIVQELMAQEEALTGKSLKSKTSIDTTPPQNVNQPENWKVSPTPQQKNLTLAEVDSISLQVVSGIGATLAGRIVKYRENLGGFVRKEQLLEVYGLEQEVAMRVVDRFAFVPSNISKIKINESEVAELAKHPYITYGEAKVIVAYRKQHGPYDQADDLLKIRILSEDWVNRLKPYLSF
ncbi:ComEA family DNA-binding protein [Pararhodonellum marinum]|uniref:ComEA family DNA-binding protein n=1 Tax=Pararhodonellum marinum TaxID=2755358 RepID=UPI00188FFA63|nr:helix-hairpin-helix domain-containing protein [Pararhodonellum marinum]